MLGPQDGSMSTHPGNAKNNAETVFHTPIVMQCRWENCSFQGGTTLHNSQGAEYVDGKGTGLMNLGGDKG